SELVLEGAEVVDRRGREDVRDMATVDECERRDFAFEPRREGAHLPNPRMLERMMLRLHENMEAEDRLEHGRVRVGDALHCMSRKAETNGHGFSFWLKS